MALPGHAGFVTKPSRKLPGPQYRQQAVVDRRDKFVGRHGDDGEGALPSAGKVIEVTKEELENVALESTRTIDTF